MNYSHKNIFRKNFDGYQESAMLNMKIISLNKNIRGKSALLFT